MSISTVMATVEKLGSGAENRDDHPLPMNTADQNGALVKPKRQRSILLPIMLITLGVGSVLLLLLYNWIHNTRVTERLEVIHTVSEIRTQSAIVHIWIEELVTGDNIDRPGIADALRKTEDSLIEITETEQKRSWSDWFLNENNDVLDYVTTTRLYFERFSELTSHRQAGFDEGKVVGIGSEIDVIYDQIFDSLLLQLDSLRDIMEQRVLKESVLQQTLSRSIGLVWIAIVGLALGGIWTHERRQHRAEEALLESEALFFQAQKADAITRISSGVAHDINNHLAAIAMQCEVIKLKKSDPEDLEARVNTIISTAAKSADMIKRLQAFSRGQPIEPEIVNVNDVLTDIEDIIAAAMASEDIKIKTRLAEDLHNTSIDPTHFEQIILNLVGNARDAMPSGGSLLVETSNLKDKSGDWVCMSVTDTGVGISPTIKDRIFDPFYSTKDMALNSGLGLATVDGISRQNGGRVLVESKVGKGTTFRVLLPASYEKSKRRSTKRKIATLPKTPGTNILLVEDNHELRQSMEVMLGASNYKVHPAESGKKALQVYAELKHAIDIAIVDVIMPGMDGKQLVDELQRTQPELNVLFISGYAGDRLSERGIKSQEVNFLSKPFTMDDLTTKVTAILERDHAGSSAA